MNDAVKWYEKTGIQSDVVVSTRIRLARNLPEYPFPHRMNAEQKHHVLHRVYSVLNEKDSVLTEHFRWVLAEDLSKREAVSLVERHLVSPEFISQPEGRAVIFSEDESVSIMINEEDHLRIQVIREGLNFKEAWDKANSIDDFFCEDMNFAFDEKLGYLTQCPTNLGTGMRASVMLHLPALQESGAVRRIAATFGRLGLVIRGTYGEGTEAIGCLYQLSNQVTLGLSEKEAIRNLSEITMQIVRQERETRAKLAKRLDMQDTVSRSLGVLKSAKLLSNSEFMKLISNVRFGAAMGMVQNLPEQSVNRLIAQVQPATLSLIEGRPLDTTGARTLRAQMVRECLEDCSI